jgi:uncharacterized membrane protein YphA (DoxX/SURF4 family)
MIFRTRVLRRVVWLQIAVNRLIKPLPVASDTVNWLVLLGRFVLAAVIVTDGSRALLGLSLRTELDPAKWGRLGMNQTWQMVWINQLELVFRWLEAITIAAGLNTRFMVLAVVWMLTYQSFWAAANASFLVQGSAVVLILSLLVFGSGRYGLDQLMTTSGRKTRQNRWAGAWLKVTGWKSAKTDKP